jgi:transposase
MMNRTDLSKERWERLQALLPPQKPKTGKPNNDYPTVINGILTDTEKWSIVA